MIILILEYAGTQAQAKPLVAPFLSLNPIVATNETVPYTEAAHAGGTGINDSVCQGGNSWKLFPVGLQVYNATSNRAIYNLLSKMIARNPSLNGSVVQFEGYSVQGVKAVDPASTAYAHREDNLLVYVIRPRVPLAMKLTLSSSYTSIYPANHTLDAVAIAYGRPARALLHAGTPGYPLNTYVNYASSDETPEEKYGYEPWRLARLRALKAKYDPQGRFNFYNPVNG